MHSCLLKKLLPFALTFVVGAFIGGLFKTHGTGPAVWTWESRSTPLLGQEGPLGYDRHRSCRMYRRDLVAETKPLVILFKPDARWPREVDVGKGLSTEWVRVTFGADGKVQQVESVYNPWKSKALPGTNEAAVWDSIERAAREIRFTPEIINGMPVSVTKEVEINFFTD